jgi:hypothetical protein
MKMETMDDTEIRIKGIEVLNQALGTSSALRFLSCSIESHLIMLKFPNTFMKDRQLKKYLSVLKNTGENKQNVRNGR